MNDEIKEIISYLKKKENTRRIKCITIEESKQLLDYINNLQQENDNLKNIISSVKEDFLNVNNELTNLQEELEEEKRINQEDLKYIDELDERIEKATNELFELKDMIYKPETRDENIPIQQKISSIIKQLNGKE